jgi:ABC-type transport system involved in multi-copper enzyme maturation permease subunit
VNRAIAAELLKLRTARLPWGLLALAVGLTAVHNVLYDSNAGGSGHASIPSLASYAGQSQAVGVPAEVLLLATVLGIIVASGEFRHKTATGTYLAVPGRARVLAAKTIAAAATGLLFGLAGAAAATVIGLSFITGHGHHVLLSSATITRYAVGATLGSALLAAAGVALGSLIRSQIAAIITIFVWGFVIENSVGSVYNAAQRYLPYTAAASLGGTNLAGGTTPLPFAAVAALDAAVAALIAVTAWRITLNADVT